MDSLKGKTEMLLLELMGMERKICKDCESPFYAAQNYETSCPICFKLDKGYNILKSDKQCKLLQEELSDCYEEIDKLEEKLKKSQNSARRYRREAHKRVEVNNGDIDAALLKKMIRLCHPDHQSEKKKGIAEEVTRWLLNKKDEIK